MKPIELNFNKRPSFFISIAKIFSGKSRKFSPEEKIPEITATWKNVGINRKHLKGFSKICQTDDSNFIPSTYPLTLVCPLNLRILAEKKAPLSLFQALNTRCKIIQHREVKISEIMDIQSRLVKWRVLEKGLEVDLCSVIHIGNEIVWENTSTFYYRGRFGKPDTDFKPSKFGTLSDAKQIAEWFLPSGTGFKFAKISGDTNPLHFMPRYSRRFGYKSDFAQPFHIIASSLKHLPEPEKGQPFCLEAEIKGPVYYNSGIVLKNTASTEYNRFDLYCQDNPRPCLSGRLSLLTNSAISREK